MRNAAPFTGNGGQTARPVSTLWGQSQILMRRLEQSINPAPDDVMEILVRGKV